MGKEVKGKKLCLHTDIDNVKSWFSWTKSTGEINVVDEQYCDFSLILPYSYYFIFEGNAGNINSNFLCSGTEEGNGTPLQYFCLENPMDGGA